jgi:hypothetical protein
MPYLISAADPLAGGRAYRPAAGRPATSAAVELADASGRRRATRALPRRRAKKVSQVRSPLQGGFVVFAKPPSFLVEAVDHIRGRHQPVTIILLDKSLANE